MILSKASSILILLLATGATATDLLTEQQAQFQHWLGVHAKSYGSEHELTRKRQVWMENDVRIREHNAKVTTFQLGHNAYSDMTSDEFAQYFRLGPYAGAHPQSSSMNTRSQKDEATNNMVMDHRRALLETDILTLPDYLNWVALGAVTPVKNQGACGSCWAFSTTGALEGAKFVKTGELVVLSEQNLLDCDHIDLGCSGGLMDNAFQFDQKNGGLCSEADYPYVAQQLDCQTNCTDVPGSHVTTFVDVPEGNEKALLAAIAMQPISVAIQASQFVFQFYKSGVLTDDSCGSSGAIDHGVLAVGYGTDLDTQEPYFLVKNSWGAQWGDSGFVKIGRKTKNQYGVCAILKLASFPIVE